MKNTHKQDLLTATLGVWLAVGVISLRAADAPATPPADLKSNETAAATSAHAADLLPTPDYSGDFLKRSTLTGDWGGLRNKLAKKGITFDLNLTQVGQGVVDGGKQSGWEYGGRGDLTFAVDTGKLGLWPGGFLTTELEQSYGHGVNLKNGGLMPVNSSQIYPIPGQDEFAGPAVNFTQFLSEYGGVTFGKFETVSGGDKNEFAHGDGKGGSQFMNLALNLNPTLMVAVPYSTLGAGVVILPNKDPNAAIISLLAVSSTGQANTTGFDDLSSDNVTFCAEGRVRTDFFGKTGHQLLGGVYSDRQFTSIDQRLTLDPSTQTIATEGGSWAVYYNFDQCLYEPVKGSGRGFGIFGRFGTADGNPNFMQYFYSFGVGGKGLMACRPNDSFGIGWYYININNPELKTPIGNKRFLQDEQGVEAYYNLALTPWAILSPDIQVVRGAQKQTLALPANSKSIDTAVVMGLRMRLNF